MQVWLFAAKRSRLPNWNVLYGSLTAGRWASAKRTIPQKGNKKDGNTNQTANQPAKFNLIKPGKDPEVESCLPEMDKSMGWNELSGEWWNCCSKYLLPTVCKHAVSKSRRSSGNTTAQHHMTPKPSTQHRHTRLTWVDFCFWFFSPSCRLKSFSLWKRVMAVVLSEPAFLMSLKLSVCLLAILLSFPLLGSVMCGSLDLS